MEMFNSRSCDYTSVHFEHGFFYCVSMLFIASSVNWAKKRSFCGRFTKCILNPSERPDYTNGYIMDECVKTVNDTFFGLNEKRCIVESE